MGVAMRRDKTGTAPAGSGARRQRLVSGRLARLFVCTFGASTSFYLLLSVVPLYAVSVGAGGLGAGLATGALMLSTVATELVTPRLIARFGYRRVLLAGLVLLGAPALALPGSRNLAAILLVCVVRGVGFAVTVVVSGALVAELVPPDRRGEGLGVSGVVVGVPGMLALPLGVWLVGRVGFPVVFVAGALAALAVVVTVRGVPGRQPTPERSLGVLAGLRTPALLRPGVLFSTTAMAAGAVVTFLPIAASPSSRGLVPVALLVQSAASTLTPWGSGLHGNRHGAGRLLTPAVLVAAAGMLVLVLVANPVAVLLGMVVFGTGFGVAQNVTLALMFQRVESSGFGTVSALWNLAYDAGLGAGAVGVGLLTAPVGYPASFALTAGVLLLALALGRRQRGTAPEAPAG
jgi:predicted MFS family arabinose efflux permease